MRGLVAVLLAVITGMFCSFVTYLPEIGDVGAAPHRHVTPTYISRSVEDTGSPNIVTGVIIDYRGFDTMWETTVMFLAGVTTMLVLSGNPVGRRPEEEAEDAEEGEVIK
ncbi:MAG: hydrogen gas-evolving membrane-bound hydrogenase subunit E [Acidaminococcaceae bacterium]|nr:hydrogen gas-evolving membrane-bound hydrogenase subunit E [Acidaminococcaceae bacterium]